MGDDGERKRKSATHTESPSPTKLPRLPGDAIQGAEDVTRLSSDLRGTSTRSRSNSPSKIPRVTGGTDVYDIPQTSPSRNSRRACIPQKEEFRGKEIRPLHNHGRQGTHGTNIGSRNITKKSQCHERDNWTCLITKGGDSVEVAHIYPFSLGQKAGTENHTDFWDTLSTYGLRYLKDHPTPSRNVDCSVDRACFLDCQSRSIIRSGDILTFTTPDPKKWPLPSVQLLHMQWLLNRLVAITGAADVTDEELDSDDPMGLAPPILVGYDDDDEEEEEGISPGM